MADDGVARIETLLEHLGSRFELVVEVAEGFGGRLNELREEMISQLSEVGRQIRFLSDQLAENRTGVEGVRAELSTEMVRLNEAVGAIRVRLKQDLDGVEQLRDFAAGAGDRMGAMVEEARRSLSEELEARTSELRDEITSRLDAIARGIAPAAAGVQRKGAAVAQSSDGLVHEVASEVKATNKALTNLLKKFDRFDDRISVQVKDQDQRLRKLERRAKA